MTFLAWTLFIVAALLEVGGDAAIRRGLRGGGLIFILAGFLVLGSYGLVVNSVLCGRYIFKEAVPASTWIGLSVIIGGGLIIQFGRQ